MGSMKISNVRYQHGGCLEPPSSLPWPNILIVGKMITLRARKLICPLMIHTQNQHLQQNHLLLKQPARAAVVKFAQPSPEARVNNPRITLTSLVLSYFSKLLNIAYNDPITCIHDAKTALNLRKEPYFINREQLFACPKEFQNKIMYLINKCLTANLYAHPFHI